MNKLSFVSFVIALVNLQCGLGCLLPPPPTGNGGTPIPPPTPRPTPAPIPAPAPAPVPNPGYNSGPGTYPGAAPYPGSVGASRPQEVYGGRGRSLGSVENNFGNICGFLQGLPKFPKTIYSRELTPDFFYHLST